LLEDLDDVESQSESSQSSQSEDEKQEDSGEAKFFTPLKKKTRRSHSISLSDPKSVLSPPVTSADKAEK
jgi:hypothetical protein